MSTAEIQPCIRVDERVVIAGQPTEAQLRAAAAEGIEVVINLAPPGGEVDPADEAALARQLGLAYHHIPVVWNPPCESDYEAFARVMASAAGKRVLIHCTACYRSTAYYSLYAVQALAWDAARAAALRGHVWEPGEYPAWDDFIEGMAARLAPAAGPH